MTDAHTIRNRLERLVRADPDVVRHAVRVSVWGRWFIWLVGAGMLARRPDLWYPEEIGFVFLSASLAVVNGVVHHRLLTNRPVTWRWMLALSAMDIALITANIAVGGRFDNLIFVTYYPALTIFAVAFSSTWLILAWVTVAAVAYFLVSVMVGPGVDIELGQDHVLLARVSVMYLVAVAISLIVRFERIRRLAAMAREWQAHQDRIELSQAIHDTTAQTAYMIGLGIEGAIKLAGDSDPKLGGATGGDGRAVQVGHVGAQEADRHGPHLRGAGPWARAERAHRHVRQDHLRPRRDAAERPGAPAVHGGADGVSSPLPTTPWPTHSCTRRQAGSRSGWTSRPAAHACLSPTTGSACRRTTPNGAAASRAWRTTRSE